MTSNFKNDLHFKISRQNKTVTYWFIFSKCDSFTKIFSIINSIWNSKSSNVIVFFLENRKLKNSKNLNPVFFGFFVFVYFFAPVCWLSSVVQYRHWAKVFEILLFNIAYNFFAFLELLFAVFSVVFTKYSFASVSHLCRFFVFYVLRRKTKVSNIRVERN